MSPKQRGALMRGHPCRSTRTEKDLVAIHDQLHIRQPLRPAGVCHALACKVAKAHAMLAEEDGLHSLALEYRYVFFLRPIVSPYDAPLTGYVVPHEAWEENVLARGRAGHGRRDLLSSPDLDEPLRRVALFTKNDPRLPTEQQNPSPMFKFLDAEQQPFRLLGGAHWRVASLAQYEAFGEILAATLRQSQRWLTICAVGQSLLGVMAGIAPERTYDARIVDAAHVRPEVSRLLTIQMGSDAFLRSAASTNP